MKLGKYGVWSGAFRGRDLQGVTDDAGAIERLGFETLWFPGGLNSGFDVAARLLAATAKATVATGIVNVYIDAASSAAAAHARLTGEHPDRFLLGVGISHKPMLDKLQPGAWGPPMSVMGSYLDALDTAAQPVPRGERVVAALGPRMLDLARDRSWGSHTYLVLPEQTQVHRELLGLDALLAPEQGVVLDRDPASARAKARAAIAMYLGLPNYLNSWRRAGFTDEDFSAGGSDRLVDALVAWGDAETVARRLEAHLAAGADHVCVQVLGADPGRLPLVQLTEVAQVLGLP